MQNSMKKELIGILICTFLISVAVAPAMNAINIEENEINEAEGQTETLSLLNLPQLQVSESNRINSIKLNPPQPAPWPPYSKCVGFGFGRLSNLTWEFNGDEYYWSFNCENAIVRLGIYGEEENWHHYTNGEKVYVYNVFFFHKGNFFLVLL